MSTNYMYHAVEMYHKSHNYTMNILEFHIPEFAGYHRINTGRMSTSEVTPAPERGLHKKNDNIDERMSTNST